MSYTSVWLLLYSLLDSPHLRAGELMGALGTGRQRQPLNLDETTVFTVGDYRHAEQAHRLLQQFLLDPEVR